MNNKLTSKQEKFAEELAKGKSQYEAYIIAYPKSKNWARNSIDNAASLLSNHPKIVSRLQELTKSTEKKIEWTRNRALNEINYVLDMHKKDMERISSAYETEIEIKEARLLELANLLTIENIDTQKVVAEMNYINTEINRLKKQRRINAVNTNGILNAAKVLNRMYGLDITKVEIKQTDEERENMKALSVEELKAIAYANIKSNNNRES